MPDTRPERPARQKWLLRDGMPQFLLFLVVGIGLLLLTQHVWNATEPYPDCDNEPSLRALARLYDNKRLLRAVKAEAPRLVHDGFKGRFCLATVTRADGSQREVSYGFELRDRRGVHRGWIEYNK